jgi:ATP-dependent DNA ligase
LSANAPLQGNGVPAGKAAQRAGPQNLSGTVREVRRQGRVHEIKFDGYRVQLHMANDDIKVFTRRGNDWTKRFRKVAADAYLINAKSAIIDGEIVVPAADGTTDFSVLQNELKGTSDKIVMVAFDFLYLNGQDVRKLPLMERKALLQKLIAKTPIQFSESFELDGREMFRHDFKRRERDRRLETSPSRAAGIQIKNATDGCRFSARGNAQR